MSEMKRPQWIGWCIFAACWALVIGFGYGRQIGEAEIPRYITIDGAVHSVVQTTPSPNWGVIYTYDFHPDSGCTGPACHVFVPGEVCTAPSEAGPFKCTIDSKAPELKD